MTTPLFHTLMKIRMNNNEFLKDMADKLGMSSSELSSIEHNKKPMPNGFMEKIKELYPND